MKTLPLSDNDSTKMVECLKYPYNLIFYLGIKTGLRVSELLSLKYSDLIERGDVKALVYVPRRNVKGKTASRYVRLNDTARDTVKAMIACRTFSNDYLFTMSRFAVYRELERVRKTLGIETKVATHGMRKSFAVKIYQLSGNDIVMTQKALGHSSVNSTIHYLEVDSDKLNRILDAI